jgi:hypothetical protein
VYSVAERASRNAHQSFTILATDSLKAWWYNLGILTRPWQRDGATLYTLGGKSNGKKACGSQRRQKAQEGAKKTQKVMLV